MSNTDNININFPKANPKQIKFFIIVIVSALILSFSFYTVGANENTVILRLGKYHTTTGPGLHFKLPLIGNQL